MTCPSGQIEIVVILGKQNDLLLSGLVVKSLRNDDYVTVNWKSEIVCDQKRKQTSFTM